MSVEAFLPEYEGLWAASGQDPEIFFAALLTEGKISRDQYESELRLVGLTPKTQEEIVTGTEKIGEIVSKADFWERIGLIFKAVWDSVIKSMWDWIKQYLWPVIEHLGAGIKVAFDAVWEKVQGLVEAVGRTIYGDIFKILTSVGQITPETVSNMSLQLYDFAYSKGIQASLSALAIEMVHPYKNLGIQQIPAMVGDYAGFGSIASATIGVVHRLALAGPMAYAVNAHCRPVIPDSRLLQTLVVKKDISIQEFLKYMKYHGYSDYWIDRIRATMYREPSYRELQIMAEQDVATDAWMIDKLERAGYSSEDAPVMHRSLIRRVTISQRSSYYSHAFSLFKEGYITEELFGKILDKLGLHPEAKTFAIDAARLAYLYDATGDQVKYWCDSYQKDLVTGDQLRLHLSLLGVVPERVWLICEQQKVRKYKKPSQPTASGLEAVTAKTQSTLSQAYIQLYRKNLIDEAVLEADLIAIGIVPELAEATVFLEQVRAA